MPLGHQREYVLELWCPANHADLLGWVPISPMPSPLNLHLIHVPNFSEKKNHIIVLTLVFSST